MEKVTVVCHDAGGSEIISSYLKKEGLKCNFVLDGPALKVFKRKFGKLEVISLREGLNTAETVICGTSWQSNIEKEALKRAKAKGLHTIVFLEHWGTYQDRFVYEGELILPDEIIVGDFDAEKAAKEYFPNLTITRIENPYLKDIQLELSEFEELTPHDESSLQVLYVCAPVREPCVIKYGDPLHWGYTEEDALRYFLDNYQSLEKEIASIVIRSHPSEAQHKYHWAIDEYQHLPITLGGKTLAEEVAKSDVVVGCETMAMVVALLAGKDVYSSIPPGNKPCRLPQKEIKPLSVLIKN